MAANNCDHNHDAVHYHANEAGPLAVDGWGPTGLTAGMQGADLSHAVLGTDGPEPDSVYLQILGPGWPNRGEWVGFWRGLRTDRWTYARWISGERKKKEGRRGAVGC